MPRRKRDLTAGTFHIYTHSVWAASALFRDDADRMTFVRSLARATGAAARLANVREKPYIPD
jgi:hypothetical protein